MSWLRWWFHRCIHMSKLIKLYTFKNTPVKLFLKKVYLSLSQWDFLLSPDWIPFCNLSLGWEEEGWVIYTPVSRPRLRQGLQVYVVHLVSRALRRPCLRSQLLWHRRLWLVLTGFELKWPQKEQHLQKWGLGKVTSEEETKSKNLTAEVTCQIPNLNTKTAF